MDFNKLNHFAGILLYTIILRQLSKTLGTDKIRFGTWLRILTTEDNRLYPFDWLVKVSVKECVLACKSTKACQYMNYEVRAHKCALIRTDNITENIEEHVVSKPGYIFGNKSEWSLVSNNIYITQLTISL